MNYSKRETLRELEKRDINWLVNCYKAKCTVQWAEEHIRKDICRLNSKLASATNTQIFQVRLHFSWIKVSKFATINQFVT